MRKKIRIQAMKYSEIKTLDELELAQKQVKKNLDSKGKAVQHSFADMKESYSPGNLLLSGLKSVSSYIPIDHLILSTVRTIKRRLLK